MMNINMNSIFQLMLASGLMSGKGFDMDGFMGGLTLDKLLGLQMLGSINFGDAFGTNNQKVDADQLNKLLEALNSAKTKAE